MKNPLVVGYKGEIGSFILQGLLKYMPKARNIWCFDINETEKEKIDRIKKSDVIFLCVPLENTAEFFKTYRKLLKGKLIIEQTSLKSVLFSNFVNKLFRKEFKVLSMHILFRPSATPNIDDRVIGIVDSPLLMTKQGVDITAFLETLCIRIKHYQDIDHHDWCMAIEQALVHRVLIALDSCILYGDTYLSKKVKELASRIKNGDKKLYQIIQTNPDLDEILKDFNKQMKGFNL